MGNGVSSILKWSMAGWVFFIETSVFIIVMKLTCRLFPPVISDILDAKDFNATSLIAFITLIGVPLGYVFYQIYYFFYWTIPVNMNKPPDEAYLNDLVRNCKYLKKMIMIS
jgi:hypothetical protein